MMKTKETYIKELSVLYEDNHLLIVEKFVDVLSQKDETNDLDMTEIIKEYLKEKYQKPGNVYLGLIHRLDRRVGGVMVFAKTSKAAARLSEDIREQRLQKTYIACVKGRIEKDGTIDLLLEKKQQVAIVSKSGKRALLHYRVTHSTNQKSYVYVNLITGRYQQIRSSFAHIGHPLLNDYKYDKTVKPTHNQLGLWCYQITFNHPITQEQMTFVSTPKGNIWDDLQSKSNH